MLLESPFTLRKALALRLARVCLGTRPRAVMGGAEASRRPGEAAPSPSCERDEASGSDDFAYDNSCSGSAPDAASEADTDSSGAGSDEEDDSAYAAFASGAALERDAPAKPVFACLDEAGLRERYSAAVSAVVGVLRCTPDEAALLLRHFKWNAARVSEEWFQARVGTGHTGTR